MKNLQENIHEGLIVFVYSLYFLYLYSDLYFVCYHLNNFHLLYLYLLKVLIFLDYYYLIILF